MAWSGYLRGLLRRLSFYCFDNIDPNLFFYVVETKILPGREARNSDEARGRALSVVWFKRDEEADVGDICVKRCHPEQQSLAMKSLTLAEVLVHAKGGADVREGESDRTREIRLEADFLNHELLRYDGERVSDDSDDSWGLRRIRRPKACLGGSWARSGGAAREILPPHTSGQGAPKALHPEFFELDGP